MSSKTKTIKKVIVVDMPRKSNWNRIWVPAVAAALGVILTSFVLGMLRVTGVLPSAFESLYDIYETTAPNFIGETLQSGRNILYWISWPFRWIWDVFLIGMSMIANMLFGW